MSVLSKPSQTVLFPGLYGLMFDLIGTLTDDHTPVVDTLVAHASRYPSLANLDREHWDDFAYKWDSAQGELIHVQAKRYRAFIFLLIFRMGMDRAPSQFSGASITVSSLHTRTLYQKWHLLLGLPNGIPLSKWKSPRVSGYYPVRFIAIEE